MKTRDAYVSKYIYIPGLLFAEPFFKCILLQFGILKSDKLDLVAQSYILIGTVVFTTTYIYPLVKRNRMIF